MKNNQGITLITLVITIIVIIIIASITVYSGINTVDSIRKKNATDTTNAIFLALIANEDIIPASIGNTKMISESTTINNRELTNDDFKLLNLDYTTDNCKVIFNRTISGDNTIVYSFTYTDDLNKTFSDITYQYYRELTKTNDKAEFDTVRKVNRPILFENDMVALNVSGDAVNNVYTESWYNYDKGVSKLATMRYKDKVYAWVPRFAYKIQSFYLGKDYKNVPVTAIDIVFLRDDTWYMPNGEVMLNDYVVHPAFANGETGFWIMTEPEGPVSNLNTAINNSSIIAVGNNSTSHLMKNSEYAAALFLSKYLGNSEIVFGDKEYLAAGCNLTGNTYKYFDIYSLDDELAVNYFYNIKGQALTDTPWNLKVDRVMPNQDDLFLMRDVNYGGDFYFESNRGSAVALYRTVISKK